MNRREIEIKVVGASGVGKTTIAELLQEFLIEKGFDSTHVEFELLDVGMRLASVEERRESVKDAVTITITEHQALRGESRLT